MKGTLHLLYIIQVVAYIGLVFAVYMLIRNEAVGDVQKAFIRDDALYPSKYRALPSYSAMLYAPRHQLRWTKAQWMAWVDAPTTPNKAPERI